MGANGGGGGAQQNVMVQKEEVFVLFYLSWLDLNVLIENC